MDRSVEINGLEYKAFDNFSITQQAGGAGSSTVDIEVDDTHPVPATLSSMQFLIDSVPVFFGIIQSYDSPQFNGGLEVKRYRLNINDGISILNNRLASEAYQGKYAHEIIQDLFTNYIEGEGITLGSISTTTQYYENYNFQYTKLSQIIDEIADDSNASFYISPDKKFYFLIRTDFTQVDAPTHIMELQKSEEAGDVRTKQIITGATEETSLQTETVEWIADQTIFDLGYQVSSVSDVTINTVSCGVGILGLDEEDTSKTFLYQVGMSQLTLNSNALVKPVATDNVECEYYGYYEVVIDSTNDSKVAELAAINGTSGIIENVYTDDTIDNQDDAENKAAALLELYGDQEKVISCTTHDITKSEILTLWNIDESDIGITGQYIVTERTIQGFGPDEFLINVSLNTKNYTKKYGTVLNPKVKNVGRDIKVYKTSSIGDTISVMEDLSIEHSGLAFWPTSGEYLDPLFQDSFYPVGE